MNPLYNWSHEMIVNSERMEDAKREAKRMRLLHDSKPPTPGLYKRTTATFRNTCIQLVQHLSGKHIKSHQTYRATDSNQHVA